MGSVCIPSGWCSRRGQTRVVTHHLLLPSRRSECRRRDFTAGVSHWTSRAAAAVSSRRMVATPFGPTFRCTPDPDDLTPGDAGGAAGGRHGHEVRGDGAVPLGPRMEPVGRGSSDRGRPSPTTGGTVGEDRAIFWRWLRATGGRGRRLRQGVRR